MSGWISWVLTPLRSITGIPQFVAGLSLAARIGLLVGVFQVVVVLLALLVLIVGGEEQQVTQAWLGRLPAVAVLLVLTPVVVHQAAKLWLERDASRFPDIQDAWQAALVELKRQGISLEDVPVFLVFGGRSSAEEERLLAEAPCEFAVRAAPAGAAALHVYGGYDAVFICLDSCSHASELARRGGSLPSTAAPRVPNPAAAPIDPHSTVFLGAAGESVAEPAAPPTAEPAAAFDASRTIDVSQVGNATIDITKLGGGAPARPTNLSTADREETAQRLAYFCELLRRERGSLAPFNGMLAVVPWSVVSRGQADAQALGRALGDDIQGIVKAAGLRTPVTVVVLGLEEARGFRELVHRMPAGERQSRLGQRFPIGATASYEQFGTVASRACGMVEDLVTGRILRSKGVLSTEGNAALVEFVCRLRSEFSGRLATILRRAFTAADGESSDALPFLAGCYLGGCGADEDARGFVRGVLEKVVDCQGDLEWTPQAEFEDGAARRAANVLWIVSGLVLAGVALLLAWKFARGGGIG